MANVVWHAIYVALTGENLNRLYQAIQVFAELFRDVEEEKKAA
jgi:hypothetical protein